MTITVNGETREVAEETTLLSLIEQLGLEGKVMAAAVNMQIVKQEAWGEHRLSADDKIELLDFVGGG
jgi:sulfur carrier protein